MSVEATDLLDELLDVRGRDVLDVGCGEGWLVHRFASAGARAVGHDPLATALERARREAPAAPFVEGTAESLPFPAASFDIVVFFNSLHHVPEDCLDGALTEAERVLRADGVLYVQEPLAEGEFFELMRPVDDETGVRSAAQAALGRAAAGPLVERARVEAVTPVRLADFEARGGRVVSGEPSRAVAIDAQASALRAAFARLGRPVE